MKRILVYSGPMCNFCEAAKKLLDRNNLKYEVIAVSYTHLRAHET